MKLVSINRDFGDESVDYATMRDQQLHMLRCTALAWLTVQLRERLQVLILRLIGRS
jgi:hypothetical protein